MQSVIVKKASERMAGTVTVPGDKSLSHRAIIFGSLAEGTSTFTNVLAGEDVVCTRRAFEAMGVSIRTEGLSKVTVEGKGLRSLRCPKGEIFLGNSGTSMRLLLGVLAGQPFEAVLTGDPSLSSRPMRRVTDFLRKMGARIEGREDANYAPLRIRGGQLRGIEARLPVASAQVKSALLLAGLYAEGETRVTEPVKSRDHTERFLSFFGAACLEKGLTASVRGGQALKAKSFAIAGDVSSAAFFMALAALVPGAEVRIQSVLWNPTRTGFVEVLKRMGADLTVDSIGEEGPEKTADITVRGHFREDSKTVLRPFEITEKELPALIDEVPILTVLATQARGRSLIRNAGELRVKETDRIRSMTEGLSRMGARIGSEGDSLWIEGPGALRAADLDSYKDHRTAMSLVVAGMLAEGQTRVADTACIRTSFPGFFEILRSIGGDYQMIDTP